MRWIKLALFVLIVLVVAYLAVPFGLAWSAHARQAALEAELVRLTGLASGAADEMPPAGAPGDALREACRGLDAGRPEGLLAYLAPLAPELGADIRRDWVWHGGHFSGFDQGFLHLLPGHAVPVVRGLSATWLALLGEVPWRWFDYAQEMVVSAYPPFDQVRYLAVGRLDGLLPPALQTGGVIRPGVVSLRVRVLAARDGQLVCEGVLVGSLPERIADRDTGQIPEQARQKAIEEERAFLQMAFRDSLDTFILRGLCERAGPDLCDLTRRRMRFDR